MSFSRGCRPRKQPSLKYTSVLERMSGGLCDAVPTTACTHARHVAGRANGFVLRLDRRREWYRYHHLGQLLRNEPERNEPTWWPSWNRRAMAWCIANDLMEEAVAYGTHGRDEHPQAVGRERSPAALLRRRMHRE